MFRRVLDAEMKVACKAGVEKKNKKAEREAVTEEEEKIMWDKNLLGCQTAKSLVRTIYFYNGKLFGIRSKEHRHLRVHNFRIDCNSVTYDESFSKTSWWVKRFEIQPSSHTAYLLFREGC